MLTVPESVSRGLGWCLLVGLAFYSADGTAALVENRLRVAPKPIAAAAAVPQNTQSGQATPPQGVAKLLATTQPEAPASPAPGAVVAGPNGTPGVAGGTAANTPPANLKLRGTMAGVGGSGLAMIDVNGVTEVIAVGEDVAGMTLAEVNTFSARLEAPGRSQVLEMDVATSLPAAVTLPAQAVAINVDPTASPTPGDGSTPGAEGTPEPTGAILTQTELRNILDNPGQFAGKGFRMKPVMRDGEIVGMRVTMRDASHPLARLGVQDGDIVRSLNGTPLNGPEALSSIYRVLRNTSNLNFDVERGGSTQSVNVSLTE